MAEGSFSPPAMMAQQRSSWHTSVPFHCGGLAAMLGLIAFAFLILACSSYWRFSSSDQTGERDLESGGKEQEEGGSAATVKVFEEKILVIMAGDENPTFLATPVCSIDYGKQMIVKKEREKVKEMADEHEPTLTSSHEENNRENQEQIP